jgi:hypothetical protein
MSANLTDTTHMACYTGGSVVCVRYISISIIDSTIEFENPRPKSENPRSKNETATETQSVSLRQSQSENEETRISAAHLCIYLTVEARLAETSDTHI